MKKIFLIIALFAGSVSLSQAQQRQQRSPEEMAQRNVDGLEKRLNLTADQKAKIYTIVLAQAKTMDSLRTAGRNSGGDRQAAFSKIREFQDENNKKISALLNDDQKKAYDQMLEERRSRMRNGQSGPGGQRPE